jgi:hypothetical protein
MLAPRITVLKNSDPMTMLAYAGAQPWPLFHSTGGATVYSTYRIRLVIGTRIWNAELPDRVIDSTAIFQLVRRLEQGAVSNQ